VKVREASLARRSESKEAVLQTPLTYKEALAWLYGLQRFGIKLGLENTRRLIDELSRRGDVPRHAVASRRRQIAHGGLETAAPWKVIHVAGTNGKGSVCAMIDSICRAQGYRTGLFTSPHLVTFRERIRVNGEMISENEAANGLATIRDFVTDWDPHPTFFEVTTALALKYFSVAKVDVAILETGIGGRLDATNAIQSDVSVITPIDFDHEEWLGNTLAQIAGEKAGIIKRGVPVVSAPQRPEAEKVIRARAAECAAPLEIVTEHYDRSPIALRGQHQKQNAGVAIAAIHAARIDPLCARRAAGSRNRLDRPASSRVATKINQSIERKGLPAGGGFGEIDDSAIARGLGRIDWPARFQMWDKRTIIDGAHNPAAARLLAETWREIFDAERATLVLAVLSDKNLRGICEALAPIADSVLLPKIRSERAAQPEELAKVMSAIAPSLPCSITPSIGGALDLARTKPNPILITGSLHFAGEVLANLRGEPAAFEECAQ
jgi:dihydrofolate synthase/folylpolyglutamate synthase